MMVLECKICLKRFSTRSSPAVSLPCDETHTFHSDCLTHWFVNNRDCPVCGLLSSSTLMTPLIESNQELVVNSAFMFLNEARPAGKKDDVSGECCECCCIIS